MALKWLKFRRAESDPIREYHDFCESPANEMMVRRVLSGLVRALKIPFQMESEYTGAKPYGRVLQAYALSRPTVGKIEEEKLAVTQRVRSASPPKAELEFIRLFFEAAEKLKSTYT